MKYVNVVQTYFIMGFREYFLARKTALMQLVVLPLLAPVLLLGFIMLMTAIMLNNVQIEGEVDNKPVSALSSIVGVVLPDTDGVYFEVVKEGLSVLPISVNAESLPTVIAADEALLNERVHAVLVFTSLSPLSIEIRSHSQKQTVYRHVLDALDSYDLAKALMPLRRHLIQEHTGLNAEQVGEAFGAGELTKVQIGQGETPIFALVIVGLFWVGAVMYPVSIAKMGLFYNNDITSDELAHCLSLRVPPLYYVLSRLAGAYAVYLPACLVMFSIIVTYMVLVKAFLLSSLAAPFYASDDISVVIEQYLRWSDSLFTVKLVILPAILVTLGIPMLLINLLIHFYSKDERTAVTYSSYLDTVSYAFPAFAAFVSASVPAIFGALPLLQQYYLLRAVVVDAVSGEFLLWYGVCSTVFLLLVVVIASNRAYHPKRWLTA